ncbi:uncharacterized protein LOC132790959 [Drosophila nasuta]|uniref:uncharacterized protein LOC132790959 n=1 Tax=Drosophila nasuta TaxID=42062 RepID=UPI00295E9D75|nr:uncharacterized protein LOC132790959 [Drosophila nasuta]
MVKPLEKASCLELRTAGLIIGWLGVFGSILYFCIATVTLVKAVKEADYVAAENGEVARSHDQTESAVFVLGGTLIGVLILGAVVSGLLIYGINQNRRSMLLPWLVLVAFRVVLSYFQLWRALFDFVAVSYSFPLFFYEVFFTGLNSYIYYVIYSLYTHMKIDCGNGRALTLPPAAEVQLKQNDPASYI